MQITRDDKQSQKLTKAYDCQLNTWFVFIKNFDINYYEIIVNFKLNFIEEQSFSIYEFKCIFFYESLFTHKSNNLEKFAPSLQVYFISLVKN